MPQASAVLAAVLRSPSVERVRSALERAGLLEKSLAAWPRPWAAEVAR